MASALKLGLIAAVLGLAGGAVSAGAAPAAYYPSLGYGQTPVRAYTGEPAYYDAPSASTGDPADYDPPPGYDRGPPRGHVGQPAYGYGPGPGDDDYPSPDLYGRGHVGYGAYGGSSYGGSSSSSSGQSYGSYSSRSEQDYGYDSGWRSQDSGHEDSGHEGSGYGGSGEERRHDDGDRGDHRGYAGATIDQYDYDSGWRSHGQESGGPLMCPFAHEHHPDPPPHPVCPTLAPHSERLSDSFFADAGGVGPAYMNGGGGGGGYVVMGSGASAGASAFASASASAHVSVSVHGRSHGGGHGMRHGCGCGH